MLKTIRYLVLVFCLFAVARVDVRQRRIPNWQLCLMFFVRTILLMAECVSQKEAWVNIIGSFAGGLILGGGIFLVCYVVERAVVGAGDVKLMAVVGYYIGANQILEMIFLILLSAAGYCVLLTIKNPTEVRKKIPFAPFVLLGTIIHIVIENNR